MSEVLYSTIPDMETAHAYVESVRAHYRARHGEYSGRRTEEQQLIAEVTADEARLILDGVAAVTMGLASLGEVTEVPEEDTEPITGGYSWDQFRGEYARLLVGFAVITNRLERDGFGVKGYADFHAEDRVLVASVLLGDFLMHNALRFGVDGVGIPKTINRIKHTEEGEVERVVRIVDQDRAYTEKEIQANMRKRGFASGVATHPAGKISAAAYRALRKEFPEMDKDQFDYAISFYKNVYDFLENQE